MLLPSNTFTHMSERWHTTSWLDHCLSSGDGHNVINDINVLYSTCCCDHIPITVDISIGCIPVLESVDNDNINLSVNLSKLSAADKVIYARDIDVHLNAIKVPADAICCKDTECSNIGVRDGGSGGSVAPPPFGQFVDINSGRESTLFGQNTIHV